MQAGADYRKLIAEYVRAQARPVDKYGHQPRLYTLTTQIGAGLNYDDDVVYAAAWLHDLGVFIGHRPEDPDALSNWDNVAYAMEKATTVLLRCGFPESKVPAVIEAIRTHQPGCKPVTLEGTILRDADILEQLGAIAVWRSVCKVGRDTRFPTFTDVRSVLSNNLENLPGQLALASAKVLAEPRIRILREFLAATEQEANGELW